LGNKKRKHQKKLKSKKTQINLSPQNKDKKEFCLLYYLLLMDCLNHPYAEVPNVLNLKQQLQMVKKNAS
jgi:hypothetical protein